MGGTERLLGNHAPWDSCLTWCGICSGFGFPKQGSDLTCSMTCADNQPSTNESCSFVRAHVANNFAVLRWLHREVMAYGIFLKGH